MTRCLGTPTYCARLIRSHFTPALLVLALISASVRAFADQPGFVAGFALGAMAVWAVRVKGSVI